jgi:hypothetical protein
MRGYDSNLGNAVLATKLCCTAEFRHFVPLADICSAAKLFFDHLVGAGEHRGREGKA